MRVACHLAESQIAFVLRIAVDKHACDLPHGVDLPFKGRVCKVVRAGHGKEEEILRAEALLSHEVSHIPAVRGIVPAHRHEVAETVHSISEGAPGIDGAHGEAAEPSVIPGRSDPIDSGAFRKGAVLGFHSRDQVVHQLIMELVRQPDRERIVPAILAIRVVICQHHDNHGCDLSVLNGVIDHVLKGIRILCRAHDGRFIAPAAVA